MKKFVLPILVIALAFGTAGCTSKKSSDNPSQVSAVSGNGEKSQSGYVDSRSDVVDVESTESGSLSQELTNSGVTSIGDITAIAAVNLWDKERCDKLPEDKKQECKDTVNFDDAVFRTDYGKCDLIESQEIEAKCVREVSEGLMKTAGSLSICAKIKDSKIRSECEVKVNAVTNPTGPKSCEALSDPNDKLQCFDQVILADVRTGKITDSATCRKVVNPVLKKECGAWMKRNAAKGTAGADSVDEGTCTGRTGTSLQYCLKDQAVATAAKSGNVSACSSVTDPTVRTACVKDAENTLARKVFEEAQNKKDPSICSKISDATLQSRCKSIVSQ